MSCKAIVVNKKAGYQMPEHFTAGTVLNDVHKNPWCLGTPIGQGGFGGRYKL